jgi:hypothetical protein
MKTGLKQQSAGMGNVSSLGEKWLRDLNKNAKFDFVLLHVKSSRAFLFAII